MPGELIPPEWVTSSAEPVAESGPAPVTELEEIHDGLQESLLEPPRYQAPDVEHLRQLAAHVPIASRNAKIDHPESVTRVCDVAQLSTAELAERVAVWVHRHRRRGLSDLDLACQREWSARALGVGYFYGRSFRPWLPMELVGVCGPRRAPVREMVLAALSLSLVKGRNGICIGAPDAEMLWGIPASTWWACIAWLEKAGLLVRMRRFKNNDVKGQAPVHLCPNWYGPGPVLLSMRSVVFAAFKVGHDDIAAELREQERQNRCRRRRTINVRLANVVRRRRGLPPAPPPGRPAPSWAMRVCAELGAERLDACEHAHARDRARELLAGNVVELGGPTPPAPVASCPRGELVEKLVRAGVETEAELAELVEAQTPAIQPAPAIPPQPVGGPPGPGGEPIPGAPARGAPRASDGAIRVPQPAARGSARADAAHALGVLVHQLPAGHPLRGWRPW